MANSLDTAREAVREMIESQNVPFQLVGDISLEDLITTVSSVVQEGIKKHLTDMDSIPDDKQDEYLQTTIETISMQMALIAFQAAFEELGGSLGETEGPEDLTLEVTPEMVSSVLTRLLAGNGVTIKLDVQPGS